MRLSVHVDNRGDFAEGTSVAFRINFTPIFDRLGRGSAYSDTMFGDKSADFRKSARKPVRIH